MSETISTPERPLTITTYSSVKDIPEEVWSQVVETGRAIFGPESFGGWADRSGEVFVVVSDDQDRVIGFGGGGPRIFEHDNQGTRVRKIETGSNEYPNSVYLYGGFVVPECEGRGIYKEITKLRLEYAVERQLPYVAVLTANPKIHSGITSILDSFIDEGKIQAWKLSLVHVGNIKLPAANFGALDPDRSNAGEFEQLIPEGKEFNPEEGDRLLLVYEIDY